MTLCPDFYWKGFQLHGDKSMWKIWRIGTMTPIWDMISLYHVFLERLWSGAPYEWVWTIIITITKALHKLLRKCWPWLLPFSLPLIMVLHQAPVVLVDCHVVASDILPFYPSPSVWRPPDPVGMSSGRDNEWTGMIKGRVTERTTHTDHFVWVSGTEIIKCSVSSQ
jgi:hypothetical protein